MIRLQVSAVLAVCDGYTGRAVAKSTVSCLLDGLPHIPQYREGGYLVFVNLSPGPHELELRSAYFQPERMTLLVKENAYREYGIALKPAPNYPFGGTDTRLQASVLKKGKPAAGRMVWVAVRAAGEEMKLAQDRAEAGSASARIFCRGGQICSARNFLVVDGKDSEVVFISDIQEGQALFAQPLAYPHKRGTPFYPVQSFCTDERGEFLAYFREPLPLEVFDPESKRLLSAQLISGDNRLEFGI